MGKTRTVSNITSRTPMTKDSPPAVASCLGCRKRHIKCHGNGVDPCPSCEAHGECCTYPKRRRAGPRKGWLQEREKLHHDALLELSAANDRIRMLEDQLREYGAKIPPRGARSLLQSHHDSKLSEIRRQSDPDWEGDGITALDDIVPPPNSPEA